MPKDLNDYLMPPAPDMEALRQRAKAAGIELVDLSVPKPLQTPPSKAAERYVKYVMDDFDARHAPKLAPAKAETLNSYVPPLSFNDEAPSRAAAIANRILHKALAKS